MTHSIAAVAFTLGILALGVPAWAQESAESVTVSQQSVTVIQQPDGSVTTLDQVERRIRFKTPSKPILPPDQPTLVARFIQRLRTQHQITLDDVITTGGALMDQVTKPTRGDLKSSGVTVNQIQKPQAGEIKPTAVSKPEIPVNPEVPRIEIPKVELPALPTSGGSLPPSGSLKLQIIRPPRPPEKPVTPTMK